MIPVFPGEPQPFKDQQRSMTKGISSTTIERGGRRENRNLGKAEGRATKSWPQRGAASGAMQVIERQNVGPQGESRLWDKSRKTAARQLRRRSGLGKPANQMSGIERVKSDEFSRIGSGFAKEFHCRYYSCSFGKFVVQMCSVWTFGQDGLTRFPSGSGFLDLKSRLTCLLLDNIEGLFFYSMNSQILLEEVTFTEKMGLLEALWSHLSRDKGGFTPPEWRGEVLKIRKERIKSGEIGFTDWEVAKKEIRDRVL